MRYIKWYTTWWVIRIMKGLSNIYSLVFNIAPLKVKSYTLYIKYKNPHANFGDYTSNIDLKHLSRRILDVVE